MKTDFAIKLLFLLIISTMLFALAACGDDDDDDSSITQDDDDDDENDTADDDDDDNDDDSFPTIALIEPLNWKRYGCTQEEKQGTALITGNYNIHGGKEGTPEEVGQALAAHGPFDVFALQECPEEYAEPIAQALDMFYFYSGHQALLTKAEQIDPKSIDFIDAGRDHFLHANIEVDGLTYSVYGVHLDWNQTGDLEARELVDDYLALDPVDRFVLMGDWNEELGSTQATILEEVVADTWSSMGVTVSSRTSWPAVMFYGAEGMQLIDNTYFNKSSGACAKEGEIIHLTPNRSDHKPQRSTVFFPDTPGFTPPMLLDVIYGLGDSAIGFLFDKPLSDASVELYQDDLQIETTAQQAIGDSTIWMVQTKNDLPTGVELTATVTSAECIDGAVIDEPISLTFPVYENLIQNPGAEEDDANWTFNGVTTTDEFNHVTPLVGGNFFSGVEPHPRASASQDIDLGAYAEIIDRGYGWLAFGGASRTGYRLVEEGTSNLLLPHDECEGLVELFDANGQLLKHISGGRYDTMYWQPWRVTESIPPGTRSARVILRLMAAEDPLYFNSASFDALHLSVMTEIAPHGIAGGNLLANSLFNSGTEEWDIPEGIIRAKDHWIPIRSNIDVISATGDYWVAVLMTAPSQKVMSQSISLAEYAGEIDAGSLALEWGAWLRTWNPRSQNILALSFLDEAGTEISSEEMDPVNIPEWFVYSKVSMVPEGAVAAEFSWIASTDTFLIGVAAFFDAPFVYPVWFMD